MTRNDTQYNQLLPHTASTGILSGQHTCTKKHVIGIDNTGKHVIGIDNTKRIQKFYHVSPRWTPTRKSHDRPLTQPEVVIPPGPVT